MQNPRNHRPVLHLSIATSMTVLAIAGCQAPGGAPSVPATGAGAAQAQAYPGTTGALYPDQAEAPVPYHLAATAPLAIASVGASAGAASAKYAIDGSLSTAWGSGTVSNPSFTATLAAEAELAAIALKLSPVGTFAVDVSPDGASWKTVLASQRTTTWNVETKTLPAGTRGKLVRLRFANAGKQVMLFDLKVSGSAPAATPAPTTAPSDAPTSAPPSGAPSGSPTSPPPAAGPVVTATSSSGIYVAARAIDGNMDTEWQSGAVSSSALTLDQGAAVALTGLDLKVGPGMAYDVQTSLDGAAWQTALTAQQNATWGLERKAFVATARYVKLAFANGGKTAMVFELRPVAGAGPAPSAAPSGTPTASPSTTPTTAPSPGPTTAPSSGPTPAPGSGPIITVDTGKVLHAATSHVLGTNRNHVANDFANGAAKLVKMQELTPTWGGGKYLYRIGHGPTDGRNDYSYMTGFHFEQCWDKAGGYPYDDLRNALRDADAMGADQHHVVNYGTGTPEEAGRYVSYLNKATDANRAAHPYRQVNARLFEIGNEIPWSMVRGHDTYAPNETVYANRAKLFAQAMRANSDVPIQIGAVASINANWMGNGWSGGATTVKNILTIMGDQVDYLVFHGYPSWPLYKAGDLTTVMAQNEWNRLKLENEIKPAIRQYAGGRDVWIADTEFFTALYNDVTRSRGLFGALYAADTLTLSMNQDIREAIEFCFDHKEMADAAFFMNGDPNKTTALFKFQAMLAKHWGDAIVATSSSQVPTVNVTGASTSVTLPKLTYTASTSGSRTWVMVTHRMNDADVKASVALGFTPSAITAYTLTDAGGWDAANATVTTSSPSSLNGYTFKKASVTIFEIDR